MISRFDYLYRDDANYKRFGAIFLNGVIDASDLALIRSKMEMAEMFVAEQVGLPSLRDAWLIESVQSSADDNGWHWFVAISSVAEKQSTLMTANELVKRFATIESWYPVAADLAA